MRRASQGLALPVVMDRRALAGSEHWSQLRLRADVTLLSRLFPRLGNSASSNSPVSSGHVRVGDIVAAG